MKAPDRRFHTFHRNRNWRMRQENALLLLWQALRAREAELAAGQTHLAPEVQAIREAIEELETALTRKKSNSVREEVTDAQPAQHEQLDTSDEED